MLFSPNLIGISGQVGIVYAQVVAGGYLNANWPNQSSSASGKLALMQGTYNRGDLRRRMIADDDPVALPPNWFRRTWDNDLEEGMIPPPMYAPARRPTPVTILQAVQRAAEW